MKQTLLLPIFLSLIALLGGCSKTTSTADSPLVFARPGDSVGLDPASHDDGESLNIAVNFFETLVTFKLGTTEIVPELAEKWEVSKDGLQYTFYLRKNVSFHDGTPFNADAVVFAINRQRDKTHPAYEFGAPYKYWENMGMSEIIKDVKKVDDFTVTISLQQPNAPFLANLCMPFMAIPSPTAVLKYGKTFDQHPIGTGAYTLKTWKKDDSMELTANENYWGTKANIKRVIVRVIPDNQVRALELKRGTVHIMEFPNPSDVAELKKDPNITILTQEGLNVGYMAFNMKKKPLDKLEVRKAISMAIDRKRIVDEIFMGLGVVAKNPMPPMVMGYNESIQDEVFNPEESKKLLEKVGVKDLKIQLWAMPVARPYNPNARKMAEFMQADLARVGIKAEIVSYDWGTYLDKIGKGEHELVLIGWQGDNGDPDNFLYTLWSKDSATKTPTNNYAYYMNEQVNADMKKAQSTVDLTEREKLYERVLEQMAKDRPFLPIAHSMFIVPTRSNVEGYQIHPTGDRRFAPVRFKTLTK